MNQDLSPIQKVLLETFKAFDQFCKDNGIQYFAAYGTLLGAVRHKGFIPWDDDMDVFMIRPEYDRFVQLKKKLASSTHYLFADYHDKGYPYDFGKFYDNTKTFWEYPQFPFIMGPFIDVFPLDTFDDQSEDNSQLYDYQHATFWCYRKSISHQSWKEIFSDFIHLNGYEGPVKLVKKLIYNPQYKRFYNRLEKIDEKLRSLEGDYYKSYQDIKSRYYKKEWFESGLELPFEDTTIIVPSGYVDWLTREFGDYMTPPPVHERTGHHDAYYMNLEKRMTVEEILEEKIADLQPKKNMNFSVLWDEIKHWRGFE